MNAVGVFLKGVIVLSRILWRVAVLRKAARRIPMFVVSVAARWRLLALVLAVVVWGSCGTSNPPSPTVTLASEGGTFVDPTTGVTFVVPPGSLARPIDVTIERLDPSGAEVAALPEDARANGAFRISGDASALKDVIAVGFPLAAAAESTQFVAPYTFDGTTWSRAHLSDGSGTFGLTAEYGTVAYVVTDHFSDWGVGTHFDIFDRVAGTPDFIRLPTGLFSTGFISAGEALALINSDAKRKTLYIEVIMEIVSRSNRATQPAEMALPSLIAKYATGSLHTVNDAVGVTDKLQAAMLAANAAGNVSQSDLVSLDNATNELSPLGDMLSAATVLADCWKDDVLAVALFQAMDVGRIRDRFIAFRQMTQGSPLYQKDPAFRDALAFVSTAFGADSASSAGGLDAQVSGAVWSWLTQNAMDQCGTTALQTLSETVFANVMPAVADASEVPGAKALAKLIWDYVLQDIIFQDFIAAGKKELVLTALGSVLLNGLAPSFLADINGLAQTESVPALLKYGNDAERTKWLMRQNYVYLNESIRRMAGEAVSLTDSSWYNTALKKWVDLFSGLPDRSKIAAALETQRAHFAAKVDAVAAAIPTGCEGATASALVEVCTGSPPAPVVLVSGQNFPQAIAVDASGVYFSTFSGIMHTTLAGGALSMISPYGSQSLVLGADGWLYAVNTPNITRIPIAGGASETLGLSNVCGYGGLGRGAAVDVSNLYFVAPSQPCGSNGGFFVGKAPKASSAWSVVWSSTANSMIPTVATDTQRLYWCVCDQDANGVNGIYAMALTGGPVQTLFSASGDDCFADLALDGKNVYWVTKTSVMKVPLGGGPATVLASSIWLGSSIATDGANVYFASSSASATQYQGDLLQKVPVSGGSVATMGSQQSVMYIALYGTCLYWTNAGTSANNYHDGSLMQMLK